MKPTKNLKPHKLTLTKTTLRRLGDAEIAAVRGGLSNFDCSITPNVCQRELSNGDGAC